MANIIIDKCQCEKLASHIADLDIRYLLSGNPSYHMAAEAIVAALVEIGVPVETEYFDDAHDLFASVTVNGCRAYVRA